MTENRLNIIKKDSQTECTSFLKEVKVYTLLRKMLKDKF